MVRYTTEPSEPAPTQVRVTVYNGEHAVLEVQTKDGYWSRIAVLTSDGTIHRSVLYAGDLQLGLRASSDGRIEVANPAPREHKTGALTEEKKR